MRDRERNEMRKGHCRHSCKHQQRIYSVARNLSWRKRHKETWNLGPGAKDPKRGDIPGKDGPPLLSQLEKLCFNGVQASWLLSTWEWNGMVWDKKREVADPRNQSRMGFFRTVLLMFLFFIYPFWRTTTNLAYF